MTATTITILVLILLLLFMAHVGFVLYNKGYRIYHVDKNSTKHTGA